MTPTTAAVLNETARWGVDVGDVLEWLTAMPDDSVDLLLCSPPYELARSYSINFATGGEAWVAWMVSVVRTAAPKVKGLIAVVCEGQTKDFRYTATPMLLAADLHRAGFNLRKPPIYRRIGIPGSGGPDWLRNDYEPIICVTRPGQLSWSDNTACGHPPRWAPGGEMSHRQSDGKRVNQWGAPGGKLESGGQRGRDGKRQRRGRPSHVVVIEDIMSDEPGLFETGGRVAETPAKSVPTWLREGMHTGVQNKVKNPKPKLMASRGGPNGDTQNGEYTPPVLANPGNVIPEMYTAREVTDIIGEPTDVIDCVVGGGNMGHPVASENEAPFPLTLAEFFVKTFAPPDGFVADCFCGSGTTTEAAVTHGRRFIGCDIRPSQIALVARRMATVTPSMFAGVPT